LLVQAQAENDEDLVHAVDAGDTLISIAYAYGVTLDQLLTLNNLHPETLLQIGQRLVVMRAPEFSDDADDESEIGAESEGEAGFDNALGGNAGAREWSPAPVTEADAPMRDPADISPRLCFAVFQDENQNGMMEPDENLLKEAAILLLDAENLVRLQYRTDGAAEPYCPDGLERKIYLIEASAPPGYGLTSSGSLRIDLRSGGMVKVDFGAKEGLESVPPRPIDPARDIEENAAKIPRSLLRELSGLFGLGLAGVVFFSGMAVSLFLRSR
jgi:murein DD-endopeptidase MepM/ murein hydrolase activator NlpD